ncbi:MAG: amidohydrolase [Lachnospiraceae bacterium]|nr:amidohydrolase [Lachnospiraceae bacterium]
MNRYLQEWYDLKTDEVRKVIHSIWEHPEICFQEQFATEAVRAFVANEGYDEILVRDVRDFKNTETATPNSVIAVYGSGHPVIAIVGELDALPGLQQDAVPYKSVGAGAGHGCGHCLMAGGAMAAASALRYAMEKEGLKGTVKLIEAPAEEGGCGKGWLVANGVFDDVDMALMWHSSLVPLNFSPTASMSVYDVDFEFFGKSAHAAGMPENGRSALDAVQLMNIGIEFMREHVNQNVRMHYNITSGGAAANIVPDYASVHYMFRSSSGDEDAREVFERGLKVAQGAALMTETQMKYKITSLLPHQYYNLPLCRFMDQAVPEVPPLTFTEEEYAFARELWENTMGKPAPEDPEKVLNTKFLPYTDTVDESFSSCTDAAIMSHVVPTVHYHGSGRLAGTPGHHWNITSTSGMSIGEKGGIYAYSVLAQGAYNVLTHPEVTKEFWDYQKSLNIPPYEFFETIN